MPYARKGTRKPKRKTSRRPPASRRRTPRISGPFRQINSADPFRSKMSVKLQYTESHHCYSGALGVFGPEHEFRLNSIFDPDKSGVGHQPYGYDQLALLYRKYKVNAVAVEIIFTDPSEDALVGAAIVQPPGGTFSLSGATPAQVKEQNMSTTRTINNTGSQVVRIKQFFPLASISGLTKLQFGADVDLFTALVTANPSAQPTIRIACGSDRHNEAASLIAKVKLTYFTTMYERKVLPPS